MFMPIEINLGGGGEGCSHSSHCLGKPAGRIPGGRAELIQGKIHFGCIDHKASSLLLWGCKSIDRPTDT